MQVYNGTLSSHGACGVIEVRLHGPPNGCRQNASLALSILELGAAVPLPAVLLGLGIDASKITNLALTGCRLAPDAFLLPQMQQAGLHIRGEARGLLLPAAQALFFKGCTIDSTQGATLNSVMLPLLAACPRLKLASLSNMDLERQGVPACLMEQTRLECLDCTDCQLAALPDGSALRGELKLRVGRIVGFLTTFFCGEFCRLAAAQLALLHHLPPGRKASRHLSRQLPPGLQPYRRTARPPSAPPLCMKQPSVSAGLHTLTLNGNCFTQLPPALSRATRLRCLKFTANPALRLTVADVDDTLRHLAALAELSLPATAVPKPVAAHLSVALPRLQLQLEPV